MSQRSVSVQSGDDNHDVIHDDNHDDNHDVTLADLEEDELFMVLGPDEIREWETMMSHRKEQLLKNQEDFRRWLDAMTRRRMFAYSRIRKLEMASQDRRKFLLKMAHVIEHSKKLAGAPKDSGKNNNDDKNNNNSKSNNHNNNNDSNNNDSNNNTTTNNNKTADGVSDGSATTGKSDEDKEQTLRAQTRVAPSGSSEVPKPDTPMVVPVLQKTDDQNISVNSAGDEIDQTSQQNGVSS
ncbi:putative uncharacterized protein DDB_G0277255 [Aplysia californica]|uniref:Uncharacterized protein n=1 Tax=Aplysia californica TaxID=6500 RepID=A0ABM0KB18_APLCA|nr:putative uncharacterized protein DDB_G0277255 [Aplysia californica]